MLIGIITYNKYHFKTHEILKGFKNKNCEIILIITPFKKYKTRKIIFDHRPNQFKFKVDYPYLRRNYINKINIEKINNFKFDYILVAGSGLINKKYIKRKLVINCHSGLIPQSRGLDSFKWSIKNKLLIGNTLHFINEKIDLGKIISHKITKIYKNDNLKKFSKRHYNNEIEMLINFNKYFNKKSILNVKRKKPTKRMKIIDEINLERDFILYKKKYL